MALSKIDLAVLGEVVERILLPAIKERAEKEKLQYDTRLTKMEMDIKDVQTTLHGIEAILSTEIAKGLLK